MPQTHTFALADFTAIDPEGGKGGRWLCPTQQCSGHTDPRRHRSVSMVVETGLWNCKRCGSRGQLTERWKPMERLGWKERVAAQVLREEERIMRSLVAPAVPPFPTDGISPEEVSFRSGSLRALGSVPVALTFLESRGFCAQTLPLLHASGVRFAHDFGRDRDGKWGGAPAIVFPIRDENDKLIACQGRMITPKEGSPKALTFGHRAFGVFRARSLRPSSQLAICEAPLDALAMAVAGFDAVALCGCSGLPEWLRLGSCGRRYLIATDADEAGDLAAIKLARELAAVGAITTRYRPGPQKDIADMLKAGTLVPRATPEQDEDLGLRVKGLLNQPLLQWPDLASVSHEIPAEMVERDARSVIVSLVEDLVMSGDKAQRAVDLLAEIAWVLTSKEGEVA